MDIMFVDDEKGIREQAKIFIEKENEDLDIHTFPSAEKALEVFKKDRSKFDVIVTDYSMPVVDGIEFLKRIRDEDQNIPFIISTGKGGEEVAMKALNLGADRYIRKDEGPNIRYEHLSQAIRKEYKRWKTQVDFEENKRKIEDLHEVVGQLITCKDEDEAYEVTIKASEKILDHERCVIVEILDDGHEIKGMSSDLDREDVLDEVLKDEQTHDNLLDERRSLIKDPDEDEKRKNLLIDCDCNSIMNLRIGDDEVFQAVSKASDHFDENDLKIGEILISHLSNSLNRLKFEEELKKKEKLYRKIFETNWSAMALLNEDFVITLTNERLKLLAEYYWKGLEGTDMIDLICDEDKEKVLDYLSVVKEEPDMAPDQVKVKMVTDKRELRPIVLTVGYIKEERRYVVSIFERDRK